MASVRLPAARVRRQEWPVALGALALAACFGVLLAHSVPLALALLAAVCFAPVVLISVPLACSIWVMTSFLGGFAGLESVPNRFLLLVGFGWLGVLAMRVRRGEPALPAGRVMLVLLLLLGVWQAVTLLWAGVPAHGTPFVKSFLYVMLGSAVVLSAITEPRHARWLAAAFVVGALVSVLWGIAAGGLSGAGGAAVSSTENRFQAGVGDPNYLAAVLVPAIMLAGGLAARRSGLVRAAAVFAVAVLVVGLAATESRGGIVATAVACAAALFVFRRRRKVVLGLIGLIAIAAIGFFSVNPAAWHRVTSSADTRTGSGRTDVWQVAWRVTRQHPIGGVGIGQFPDVSPQYVREPGTLRYVNLIIGGIVVHNLYLQTWAETGIVGLLLLLGLAAAALESTRRAISGFDALGDTDMATLARCTLLALVAMLTASFFLSDLDDRRLWILFAFGPALAAIARRHAAVSTVAGS